MKDKIERTRKEIIGELVRSDVAFYFSASDKAISKLLREGHTGYDEMTNKELAALYWIQVREDSATEYTGVVVIGTDLKYLDLAERRLKCTVESYFERARNYEKGKSWFREMTEAHRLLDILLYLKGERNSQD